MKKLNKIIFALPLASMSLVTVTSCNNVDFTRAKQYMDELWPIMRESFSKTVHNTPTMSKGLDEIARIESTFIDNKVNNYWTLTIINLRKESYSNKYWTFLYGTSGSERAKYYEPLKTELIAAKEWIGSNESIVDGFGNSIDFIHMIATYNAWVCGKSTSLKDLAGWGGDVAQAAADLKEGKGTPSFGTEDLYADVDGANLGLFYNNWESEVKTSSLPIYEYYTNLTNDKDRFSNFYNKVWQLNKSSSIDTKVNTLLYRMYNNTYLQLYIKSINLSWNADIDYFKQVLKQVITQVEDKMN